jgi:hypothetical protein
VSLAKKKAHFKIENYNSFAMVAVSKDMLVVEGHNKVHILNRQELTCDHKLHIEGELKDA